VADERSRSSAAGPLVASTLNNNQTEIGAGGIGVHLEPEDPRPPRFYAAKAWNCRMNRSRVKVAWKFDRKTARRKFGYKSKFLKLENRERTVRGPRFARVLRGRERR
jgi:hypothetical protein